MKKTRDREILALSFLVKTLRPLDIEARKRAIDYALNRLKEEDGAEANYRPVEQIENSGVEKRCYNKPLPEGMTPEERQQIMRKGYVPDGPEDATLLSPRKVTVVDKATGE